MPQKNILITGTSSGIGFATALELSNQGYTVYASVRKESDAEALKVKSKNKIKPIILDVSRPEQIEECFNYLQSELASDGLMAIINNAGILYAAPFEYSDEEQARKLMEVNFFGLYKLSQKFIPLLLKYVQKSGERAKLVNIGSIGSTIGLPFESFYHASKFAVFGLSESMKIELEKLNIDVSVVMPGGVATKIFDKSLEDADDSINSLPQNAPESYKSGMKSYMQVANQLLSMATQPEIAAKRIARLISKKRSPLIWLVGRDARAIYFLQKFLPRPLLHALLRSLV
jgi:short-subunit dehydrogenase